MNRKGGSNEREWVEWSGDRVGCEDQLRQASTRTSGSSLNLSSTMASLSSTVSFSLLGRRAGEFSSFFFAGSSSAA